MKMQSYWMLLVAGLVVAVAVLSVAALSGVFDIGNPSEADLDTELSVQSNETPPAAPPRATQSSEATPSTVTTTVGSGPEPPSQAREAVRDVGNAGKPHQTLPPEVGGSPLLRVADNGDGTYALTWQNMVKPFEVFVDGTRVAGLSSFAYIYEPPRAGGYNVCVRDSAGATVAARLIATGVLAEGNNDFGQLEVSGWRRIVDVSAGYRHTVGLTSAGHAVAVGDDSSGQCDVASWSGIVDVEAGWHHTLGLRSDGTVVAAGLNEQGQSDVATWTAIRQLAAGESFSVGLTEQGTVVATGSNEYGQCDVSEWTDIVQVACGSVHTLGLRSDGTVLYAGPSSSSPGMHHYGQNQVTDWSNVAMSPCSIAAGSTHSLAVHSGGVLSCGSNRDGQRTGVSSWTSIVSVDGGLGCTVGLRSDGTALVAGEYELDTGECRPFGEVPTWSELDQVSAQGDFVVGLVR